ncbi:hypothetical protein DPMN_157747 [Dreissena polymorpha]|uniref:Reverse transcriptase domain-containing protein n=1 Tax=Dreissena polymorpha TaxID=45954 RepID=A0A9D4EIG9_DREPO|nr:hypothetical protein DPMN_157747 [Dreissena polymorpha]
MMRDKSYLSRIVYKGVANMYSADHSRVKDEYYKDKIWGAEDNTRKVYAIPSELVEIIDEGQVTIVAMVDLSVAFNTIDIPILIRIRQDEFGIHGIPLQWFNSYLTNRTMNV